MNWINTRITASRIIFYVYAYKEKNKSTTRQQYMYVLYIQTRIMYNIFNNVNARTTFNATFLFSCVRVCNCCCFFSFLSISFGLFFSLTWFTLLICPCLSLSVALQPSLLLVISFFYYYLFALYVCNFFIFFSFLFFKRATSLFIWHEMQKKKIIWFEQHTPLIVFYIWVRHISFVHIVVVLPIANLSLFFSFTVCGGWSRADGEAVFIRSYTRSQ